MVFQKITEVGNLVFQKITEVGNLCRAGRAWEKTGREPGTPPPIGGASALARQQFSRRFWRLRSSPEPSKASRAGRVWAGL